MAYSFDELQALTSPAPAPQNNSVAFEALPPTDDQEGLLPTAGRLGTAVLRGASKGISEGLSVASFGKVDDQFLNVFGESKTAGEEVAESIGNFASGFLPAIGIVGKVGKVAKAINAGSKVTKLLNNRFVQTNLASAITDFAFIDENTKRLSNIAEEHGIPFADILAQSDTDDEFVSRLKSVSEGLLIGNAVDLLAVSGKALFKANKLKQSGATIDEIQQALATDPQISATAKAIKEANEAEGTAGLVFKGRPDDVPTTPSGVTGSPVASGVQPLADPSKLKTGARPDLDLRDSALDVPRGTAPVSKGQLVKLFATYEANAGKLALEDIATNAPEVLTSIRSLNSAKDTENWFGSFVNAFSDYLGSRKGGVIPDAVRSDKALEYLKNSLDKSGFEGIVEGARASAQFASQLPVLANSYQMALSLLNVATKSSVDTFLSEMGSFSGVAGRIKSLSEAPKSVEGLLKMLGVQKSLSGYFKQIGTGAGRTLRVMRRASQQTSQAEGVSRAVNEILGPSLGSSNQLIGSTAQELLGAVNSKGGLKRLEELALKLKLAGNDEIAFSKIVDAPAKGLDRLATYTINALLSQPKTFATLQLASNSLTALFLPVERASGGLLRGDIRQVKDNLRIIGYYTRLAGEATKWTIKSLKAGQNFINASSVVTEQVGKKEILGGIEGVEKMSPTLAQAFRGIDVLLTSPTRFMQAIDEGFKQIEVRSFASAHLHGEALEAGLRTPQEIAKYVDEGLDKLITQDGALNSEMAIRGQARKQAKEQGLNKFDAYELEERMVETWQPRMTRLEKLSDDFAKEATFTRQGVLVKNASGGYEVETGITQAISSLASQYPLIRIAVLPFVNTPMNVLKAVGQRLFPSITTRIPVIKGLHKQLIADITSGDPIRMASAEGRIAMGNLISTTALMASASGVITGTGPSDEQERKLLMQTGWQPQSIRIPTPEGDKYVSYAKLDPFASFFGITADFLDAMSRADEAKRGEGFELFAQAITIAMSANLVNKSYVASLDQAIDLLQQPDRYAEKYLQSKVSSLIPAGLGGLAPIFRDEEMVEIRSISDAIMSKIPNGNGLEAKRNLLGEKVRRNSPSLVDYFLPTALSEDKNDKVITELSKLHHGFRNPSSRVNGIELLDYRLPNGQTGYDRYMELTGSVRVNGKTLRQSLDKLISSKAYQKLPDENLFDVDKSPRISEIKKVLNVYRKKARFELQNELPKLKTQFRVVEQLKDARDSGRSVEGLIQQLEGS
jgi:hypothetical protein